MPSEINVYFMSNWIFQSCLLLYKF